MVSSTSNLNTSSGYIYRKRREGGRETEREGKRGREGWSEMGRGRKEGGLMSKRGEESEDKGL